MFHRNHNNNNTHDYSTNHPVDQQHRRFGFFGKRHPSQTHPTQTVHHNDVYYGPNSTTTRGDGVSSTHVDTTTTYNYAPPSTQSDWDHYAVRHEDALIGDPIPYSDSALGHAHYGGRGYTDRRGVPTTTNQISRGPMGSTVNYGPSYDGHYYNTHPGAKDNRKVLSEGPITFDSALDRDGKPLRGNYATGSVIEDGYAYFHSDVPRTTTTEVHRGPLGSRTVDQESYEGHSWGSAPLWGSRTRDYRDNRTPLLPDNPWTHNEMGREYLDGRTSGLYQPAYDAPVHHKGGKRMPAVNKHPNSKHPNHDRSAFFHHDGTLYPTSELQSHGHVYPNNVHPSNVYPNTTTRY